MVEFIELTQENNKYEKYLTYVSVYDIEGIESKKHETVVRMRSGHKFECTENATQILEKIRVAISDPEK